MHNIEVCLPSTLRQTVPPENKERRSYERSDFANRIVYVSADDPSYILIKGVTMNISETGLCFATFTAPKKDERIWILESILPIHRQKGTVRWIKKMESDICKVGLMFQENEANP
jgi:hypothetical protein